DVSAPDHGLPRFEVDQHQRRRGDFAHCGAERTLERHPDGASDDVLDRETRSLQPRRPCFPETLLADGMDGGSGGAHSQSPWSLGPTEASDRRADGEFTPRYTWAGTRRTKTGR